MNTNSVPQVILTDVKKEYRTNAGIFPALNGVSFSIYPGEFVTIVGKSGSGKSTLLNMITGIDKPSGGEVFVAKTPVHKLNENKTALFRGQHIGIVFQFYQLLPGLTVLDNIMLPMDFCSFLTSSKRKERALSLLEKVNLKDQANKLPGSLSGGQQQRVAIARALANDPDLIVADEPTGNLDTRTARSILNLFNSLKKDGKTIIMVTHERGEIPGVDRKIIIEDGMITAEKKSTGEVING